ncbi:hypothetical protein [Rhodococcoides fascians]|uniref:hypothetical protein n=1 Tax=Rhodococcoides fascians TaxID=1828 RepID=UPI001179E852|nr:MULTISPECIES: hypothetical protein [Rhodococcus]
MSEAAQESESCWTCGGDWDDCRHSSYSAYLPSAPEWLSWNCVDAETGSVKITLVDWLGRVRGEQKIAVDLYGTGGVREAGQRLIERDATRLWYPMRPSPADT